MKKTGTFIASILLLMAGCARFVNATEVIDTIQMAAANNHQLENGKFETLLSMETENEAESIYQRMDGTFTKTNADTYDWYYVTYFPGKHTLISSELVEKGGKQFQKVIIDPLERADWHTLDKPIVHFDGITMIFDKPEIIEAEIEDVTVEKEETCTQYQLKMNDQFLERHKGGSIAELEQGIEALKTNEAEDVFIQSMEEQVDRIENTHYDGFTVTYVVDENDFLTRIHYTSEITLPDGIHFTLENTYSLMAYNLSDTAGLMPTIP